MISTGQFQVVDFHNQISFFSNSRSSGSLAFRNMWLKLSIFVYQGFGGLFPLLPHRFCELELKIEILEFFLVRTCPFIKVDFFAFLLFFDVFLQYYYSLFQLSDSFVNSYFQFLYGVFFHFLLGYNYRIGLNFLVLEYDFLQPFRRLVGNIYLRH